MKVQEKGTDRKAEVHLHIHETVNDLQEYGEYVDPVDNAICCYVAVEEGNIIKVTGKFHGTTLTIAHDTFVDGVLRKANNYVGKTVKLQKSKPLDCEKALLRLDDGFGDKKTLDTEMKIAPVSGVSFTQDEGPETIGTIEVRLYVLRMFCDDQPLGKVPTYLDCHEDEDDDEEEGEDKKATYKTITPEYMINFERNCQELDITTAKRWKKRLVAKRPGRDPWAIFRFHYRSKEAIEAKDMEITHDHKWKGKGGKIHDLKLDAVPELRPSAKPAKPDDGGSTPASSPPPTPFSPILQTPATPLSPSLQKRMPFDDDACKESASLEFTNREENISGAGRNYETSAKETSAADNELETTKPTEDSLTPAPTTIVIPPIPLTLPTLKRPGPPTPLTIPPEAKRSKSLTLTETRKQLKLVKQRREIAAKKRIELDAQLAPFKMAMEEEQERLAKELEEESRAWREEQAALRDDAILLADFKKADNRN
ncbi:hypothetical protein N0V90_003182 [Kalmusia sp. IMI 367209]|nr:hypothetical protein N0V90_003182 [Kalmusia sp. IMI 367209]